jgi:hypothetical protein
MANMLGLLPHLPQQEIAAVPQATERVRRRGNGECRRRVTSCVN